MCKCTEIYSMSIFQKNYRPGSLLNENQMFTSGLRLWGNMCALLKYGEIHPIDFAHWLKLPKTSFEGWLYMTVYRLVGCHEVEWKYATLWRTLAIITLIHIIYSCLSLTVVFLIVSVSHQRNYVESTACTRQTHQLLWCLLIWAPSITGWRYRWGIHSRPA